MRKKVGNKKGLCQKGRHSHLYLKNLETYVVTDKFGDNISLTMFYCFVSDFAQRLKQLGSNEFVM